MKPEQVIATARDWIGVPFQHQGRSRYGVDCAGLVICVCRELGLLPADFDVNGYERSPDGTMFKECDSRLARSVPKVGGVFVMRFVEEPQHMGFFADYRHGGLSIIHSLSKSGKVVEHRLDNLWRSRIVGSFVIPGVEWHTEMVSQNV